MRVWGSSGMSSSKKVGGRRVLMIGLDAFELSLAEKWMSEGDLPNIARVRARSARVLLDHGRDKFSGLGWEHVSAGLKPEDGGRWSAVTFDPQTYGVRQDMTSMTPFMANLSARTVVFDPPYCDLERAPRVRGVTNWGAHDPGVAVAARPSGLLEEMRDRFGAYPAAEWIYGFNWPSAERTRAASEALERALDLRTRAARWLLSERLPDWDLAVVVIAEVHSATEPQWHGVDPGHPLHGIPSSQPAAEGIRRLYRATDRLVGELCNAFPDATAVLFSLHGMGPNDSDVATMTLLPELLYRHAFGRPYMRPLAWKEYRPDGTPLIPADADWDQLMQQLVPAPVSPQQGWLSRLFRNAVTSAPPDGASTFANAPGSTSIDWMPASRYRPFWHRMEAFALPAFYDGRVRINLKGRESRGKVARSDYRRACERIVKLLRECRNLQNGEPVADEIYWGEKDPMSLSASEADIYIFWRPAPVGLTSASVGTIGPIPYRRTGGHTGAHGFMYVSGESIVPGDVGSASSFDVVPTVLELVGETAPQKVSGRSVAPRMRAAAIAARAS
jgi:predicted AlkP superfamily phosphohydrolase/phosphomutase